MKAKKIVLATVPAVALAAILLLPAISGAQNFGSVQLHTGFLPDPQMLSGTSGGAMRANTLGPSCRGFVTSQPDHFMFLNTPFTFMRVFVRSSGDTTLVVRGPVPSMAVRCNDDRFGTNPAVEGNWAPGQYHIWVGSYAQSQRNTYQIGFTEISTIH